MIDLNHAFSCVDYREELAGRSEEQQRAFLAGLDVACGADTPALNELRGWLRSLLDQFEDIPNRSDREVVERRKVSGGCYQLEMVCCGKKTCKCARGELHGPYWYLYQRSKGKLVSRYIGKKKPDEVSAE